MITDLFVIDVGRKAIMLVLYLSGPMLIAALVVGLTVSLFQAATHINEMTMTFIPKILTVTIVLLLTMPTMFQLFRDFFENIMSYIPNIVQ